MIERSSRSRRRWTQFSLRTLLTIMLVVAAFLAGRVSVRPELERLRAAELEAIGQFHEEQVARQDAEGELWAAKEKLRTWSARLELPNTIERLKKESARPELTSP